MKQIYTLLLALLAFAMPANAYRMTLYIDNPDAVTVYEGTTDWKYSIDDFKQYPVVEVTEGDNIIDSKGYYWIVANEGYVITKTTGPYTNSYPQELPNGGAWTYTNRPYEDDTNNVGIYTKSAEEFYDCSISVKCDDFSMVEFMFNNDWNMKYTPNIEEGTEEITIPYNSEAHTTINFQQRNYNPFYRLTIDGVDVECGSSYEMELADGKKVEILCNYPEIECYVNVVFANEGTEACVTTVKVDGELVENVDFSRIPVMCGKSLELLFDSDTYEIKSVTLNGEPYGTWSFYSQIVKDSEIVITAEKYPTLTKNIYVEGAEFFKLCTGSWEDGTPVNLVEGENTYEYTAANKRLYLYRLTTGYYMAELSDNGQSIEYSKWGTTIELQEEGDLRIVAKKIEKDKKMIVYIDANKEERDYYGFDFFNSNYEYYASSNKTADEELLNDHYSEIDFYDGDGWFRAQWSNVNDPKDNLYINDVKQEYSYRAMRYDLEPAHNDIIKIFLLSNPEPVQLTFETVGEDVQAEGTKDLITPVDLNSTYSVLPGTQVNLNKTGDHNILVTVGNETEVDVESLEFTVTEDTHVVIKASITLGVENVAADAVDENAAVYNMQGVKVGTKADMNRLPKGIYVVGGVKVIK